MNKICPKCKKEHIKSGTYCSRSCANSRVFSEEARRKKSISAKLNPAGAILNRESCRLGGVKSGITRNKTAPPETLRVCPNCNNTFKSRYKTFCTENCGRDYGAIGGYQPNSSRVTRTVYKGIQLDSGAELAFVLLLEKHNIEWSKPKISFDFIDSAGISRKYYPDFYLPKYNQWVEIKGKRYVRPDDELRRAAVPGIELIMSHEIRLPKCIGELQG